MAKYDHQTDINFVTASDIESCKCDVMKTAI